ncbi:MAG: multidrug efflux pump subunit AcrB [Patiriisocius sp.]
MNKRTRISTFEKIKDFKKSKKREFFFPNKETKKYLKEISNKIQQQNKTSFFKKVLGIAIALVVIYFFMSSSSL